MTKPNKNTVETVKTVVIAVLVTAVVTFVSGMQYQSSQTAKAEAKVQAAVEQVSNTQVSKSE